MSSKAPGHLKKEKQIKEILPLIKCFKDGKGARTCSIEKISFTRHPDLNTSTLNNEEEYGFGTDGSYDDSYDEDWDL